MHQNLISFILHDYTDFKFYVPKQMQRHAHIRISEKSGQQRSLVRYTNKKLSIFAKWAAQNNSETLAATHIR